MSTNNLDLHTKMPGKGTIGGLMLINPMVQSVKITKEKTHPLEMATKNE